MTENKLNMEGQLEVQFDIIRPYLLEFAKWDSRGSGCVDNINGFQYLKDCHERFNGKPISILIQGDRDLIIIQYGGIKFIFKKQKTLGKGQYGIVLQYDVQVQTGNKTGIAKGFRCAIKCTSRRTDNIATETTYNGLDCGTLQTIEFEDLRFVILPLLYGNLDDFCNDYVAFLHAEYSSDLHYIFTKTLLLVAQDVHRQLECLRKDKVSAFMDLKPQNIGFVCDGSGSIRFPLIDVDSIKDIFGGEHIASLPFFTSLRESGSEQPRFLDHLDPHVGMAHRHMLGASLVLLLHKVFKTPVLYEIQKLYPWYPLLPRETKIQKFRESMSKVDQKSDEGQIITSFVKIGMNHKSSTFIQCVLDTMLLIDRLLPAPL